VKNVRIKILIGIDNKLIELIQALTENINHQHDLRSFFEFDLLLLFLSIE
jgi:hypothetical protein